MLDLDAIQERLDKLNHPDACTGARLHNEITQDAGDMLAALRRAEELAEAWEYKAATYDIPLMAKAFKWCALRLRETLALTG